MSQFTVCGILILLPVSTVTVGSKTSTGINGQVDRIFQLI
jgi:hypothetical protein